MDNKVMLKQLKKERHEYQLEIDKLIRELNVLTEAKNSKHFEINKLKRLIREDSKENEGRWS